MAIHRDVAARFHLLDGLLNPSAEHAPVPDLMSATVAAPVSQETP
jgi:hypothetical protein